MIDRTDVYICRLEGIYKDMNHRGGHCNIVSVPGGSGDPFDRTPPCLPPQAVW